MAFHQVQQDWDMEKALDWGDEYEDDEGYVHGTEEEMQNANQSIAEARRDQRESAPSDVQSVTDDNWGVEFVDDEEHIHDTEEEMQEANESIGDTRRNLREFSPNDVEIISVGARINVLAYSIILHTSPEIGTTCIICQKDRAKGEADTWVVSAHCPHEFHRACLDGLLNSALAFQNSITCPSCLETFCPRRMTCPVLDDAEDGQGYLYAITIPDSSPMESSETGGGLGTLVALLKCGVHRPCGTGMTR
jgi:hypothetical protein